MKNAILTKYIFLISLICYLFSANSLFADISVKSFRKLETDMDARVNYPLKDQNGDFCAIIKVVTSQTGFSFDGGMIGIMKTEQHTGEIWVYVPHGIKHITIQHQQLGVLRDYPISIPVETATAYEMVLVSGRVETTVVEEINSQWLFIKTTPSNALIYIDDQFVKSGGEYSVKMKPGKYTYRVDAPLYHTDAGSVEIIDTKKTLNIALQPAFGYLQINSNPEQGAAILIDGKPLSSITPLKTDAIASGEHSVQLLKDMYAPAMQKVVVTDGQTTVVNFTLQPNFAELSIAAPTGAKLYINNESKGTGSWQGRLGGGVYSVEARIDKYHPARQDIELAVGDKKTVNLQPTPIYGSLDINSIPGEATITINGKDYGSTPSTINKLLIGDYTVQLSKAGYASVNRNVTIIEGKSSEVNESLSNGRTVSICSSPAGAELYVDNQLVGTTPYTGSLTFGSHTLRIEQNGKKTEKIVTIRQTGGMTDFNLYLGSQNYTETVKGLIFNMVSVKGGAFQMGGDMYSSKYDKPVHTVTVDGFLIGETEVTQAQWQVVMGSTPSRFKGENKLPVENVSWYDVQEFIRKLNKLTGKTYRLPTEAEWEFAARGGIQSKGYTYSGGNYLDDVAWYERNSGNKTHPVGTKQPNELGIYDMSGNVREWCSDWRDTFYSSEAQTNPQGATTGENRINRGGGADNSVTSNGCSVSCRNSSSPDERDYFQGFRLVLCP